MKNYKVFKKEGQDLSKLKQKKLKMTWCARKWENNLKMSKFYKKFCFLFYQKT